MHVPSTIDKTLELVELRLRDEALVDSSAAARAIAALLGGGKRIRARLVVEIGSTGAAEDEAVICAAVGVELLHLSSLIHDDLVDGATHRRGNPALHTVVGTAESLFIGNVLAARGIGLAGRSAAAAGATLAAAAVSVNRGQLLERSLSVTDEAAFLAYIALKTASMFAAAARIGSMLAGHNAAKQANLEAFGWHFGMMFQMVDDLCDFAGDPGVMGKPIHQDLRNGVFTLPIQNAAANDPSVLGLIGVEDSSVTYARMFKAVDLPHVMEGWAQHSRAAQRHLARGLGAPPPRLRELPDIYSVTVLQRHGLLPWDTNR